LDEIDLFPEGLREQSLSPREIVLPYHQAVEALSVLVKANWAFLGWEGWVKYPDGRHGHPPGQVIGAEIAQEEGEPWADYVHRSAQVCAFHHGARTTGLACQPTRCPPGALFLSHSHCSRAGIGMTRQGAAACESCEQPAQQTPCLFITFRLVMSPSAVGSC
jgi:hypothetical protein